MPKRDIKRCPECGISFVKQDKDHFYCTPSCGPIKSKRLLPLGKCKRCNQTFERKNVKQLYCTRKCTMIDVKERAQLQRALEARDLEMRRMKSTILNDELGIKAAHEYIKQCQESKKKC